MATPHWVYILTNQSGCYYVGMTRDPFRRWWQHTHRRGGARLTGRYHITRLVYLRECPDRQSALRHERSLKRRSRERKRALILKYNPHFEDLAVIFGWRDPPASRGARVID